MDEKTYNKIEKFEETEKPKETFVVSSKPKNQFKVLNIIGNEIVLEDKNKNGIRIPIPAECKKVKIGDMVYLDL